MQVAPIFVRDPFLVDAIEPDVIARAGARVAALGREIQLSTTGLETYFFSDWRPELFDLLVVAAAVEFCDVTTRRPMHGWSRRFSLRVAVHDPSLWSTPAIREPLESAVAFLTGDEWDFDFIKRASEAPRPRTRSLPLSPAVTRIMPYSNGLDSRAVAAIFEASRPGSLVRVRLGAAGEDLRNGRRTAFNVVPYEVKTGRSRVERSARSRGFKFAAVTGIAAALAKVEAIVVTESGQGALGPALTTSGQIYPDLRVHPTFMRKMEVLFEALTERPIRFEFPRLWNTKGETLREAASLQNPPSFEDARSCWQSSRQVAVDHRRRQCGVCAACLLRRMSLHSADLPEPVETYVFQDLSAEDLADSAPASFTGLTKAMREHAIAGVLHLDHLASVEASQMHQSSISRFARGLARAMQLSDHPAEARLRDLLRRHTVEWARFVASLGPRSFVARIAAVNS